MANELSPLQRDVILRLRLDPTDQKKGYEEARRIQAAANAQMLVLDAEKQRLRGQMEGQYSTLAIRETRERIAATTQEMDAAVKKSKTVNAMQAIEAKEAYVTAALKRDALIAELAGYDKVRERLSAVSVQMREQAALSKEARLASTAFSPSGPIWQQPWSTRVLGGFTAAGALQMLGLTALGTNAPQILKSTGEWFVRTATDAGKFAHEIDLVSQKTGTGMRDLQMFGAIGKSAGLELNDLTVATRKFSAAITGDTSIDEGSTAMQKGAKILGALQIATKDAVTGAFRPLKDVMLDVADVFKQLPDGAEKSKMAVELFGRSGLALIPFLNLGREGVAQLQEQFAQFMPDMGNAAQMYEKLEIAQAKYDISVMALKSHMADELLPTIISVVEQFAALLGLASKGGSIFEQLAVGTTRAPGLEESLTDQIKAMGLSKLAPVPGAQGEFEQLTAGLRAGKPKIFTLDMLIDPTALATNAAAQQQWTDLQKRTQAAQESVAKKFAGAAVTPEMIAAETLLLEGKLKEKKADDSINDTLKERMKVVDKILAMENDRAEKRKDEQIANARFGIGETIVTGQNALADARLRDLLTPGGFLNLREQSAQRQLDALKGREATVSGDALLENLTKQKDLNKEILDIHLQRYELTKKEAKEAVDAYGEARIEIDKLAKEMFAPPSGMPLWLTTKGPQAPLGAQAIETFQKQNETVIGKGDAGLLTAQQQIDAHKQIIDALKGEISARLDNQNMSEGDVKVLGEMNRLLAEQIGLIEKLRKQTPFGNFIESFKEFSDVVGKFSPGLSRGFSQIFASFGAIGTSVKQLSRLSAAPGGLFSGGGLMGTLGGLMSFGGFGAGIGGLMAPMFGSAGLSSPFQGAMSGALAAGAGAAGIGALFGLGGMGIAATIGGTSGSLGAMATAGMTGAFTGPFAPLVFGAIAAFAIVGALKGNARSRNQQFVEGIKADVKAITDSYNSGTTNLVDTINALNAERAKAVSETRGGKNGNQAQMQQVIAQIDSQLAQLKAQQKKTLDDFREKIGLFAVPEGARSMAQSIADIAKQIKAAGDAGATAAEQIAFLNASLKDLQTKTGQTLRTDEQNVISMMLQSLDLTKQRQQIIDDSNRALLDVRRSIGLAPALTPAQEAAQRIKDIKKQRDDQLAQIDQQQAMLKAQLDGQAQLFGMSLKDLDVAGEKTVLLARQLAIQRAITAETVAGIQAQQAMFAQLAAGKIPSLPSGVLPPGFSFPIGGQYTIQNATINITVPNATMTGAQMADIVRQGLARINMARNLGY